MGRKRLVVAMLNVLGRLLARRRTVCLVCTSTNLVVTAEGGLGQNVRCDDCGSLHMNSPSGWKLLRVGVHKAKVMYKGEALAEFPLDEEALQYCKDWNTAHGVRPGAYVLDIEGVIMTDPLHPELE